MVAAKAVAGARASMAGVVVVVAAAALAVAGAGVPQGAPPATMAEASRWKVSIACIFPVPSAGGTPPTCKAARGAACYRCQTCCWYRMIVFKCRKVSGAPCQQYSVHAAEQWLPLISLVSQDSAVWWSSVVTRMLIGQLMSWPAQCCLHWWQLSASRSPE